MLLAPIARLEALQLVDMLYWRDGLLVLRPLLAMMFAVAVQLVIDGNLVDALSGKTFETLDPRSGDKIHDVADGDKHDVDKAVDSARKAFDEGAWPRMGGKVFSTEMPCMHVNRRSDHASIAIQTVHPNWLVALVMRLEGRTIHFACI